MNDQEREGYERAVQDYKRTKDYKAALTGRNKKLMEQIESVRIGSHYQMTGNETMLFAEMFNNNMINASFTIYRLGYMRGQRAIQNRQKKEPTKQKATMSEDLLQDLDKVRVPDTYGITFNQTKEIIQKNNSSLYECIADAVRFGYLVAKREAAEQEQTNE